MTVLNNPSNVLLGEGAEAVAINAYGDSAGIVAAILGGEASQVGMYWTKAGKDTELTTLNVNNPGANSSDVYSMNNAGDICGDSNGEAVVWSSSGSVLWADHDATYNSSAFDIKATGYTCGYAASADGFDPVLWSPTGVETALANPGTEGGQARAINATEETCGNSGDDAMRWSSTGAGTVLGKIAGARLGVLPRTSTSTVLPLAGRTPRQAWTRLIGVRGAW